MKRRLIASLLGILLLFSTSAIFAENNAKSQGDNLFDLGIITGTGKGLEEEKLFTREELVTILIRLSETPDEDAKFVAPEKPSFSDVPKNHWAYRNIELAKKKGLTNGIGNGKFGLGQKVNYNQIELFLARSLGYDTKNIEYKNASKEIAEQCGLKLEKTVDGNVKVYRGEVFELLSKTLLLQTKDGGLKIDKLNYDKEKISAFKEAYKDAVIFDRESIGKDSKEAKKEDNKEAKEYKKETKEDDKESKKEETSSDLKLPEEFKVVECKAFSEEEQKMIDENFKDAAYDEFKKHRKESPAKVKAFIKKYLTSDYKKLELNQATADILDSYDDIKFTSLNLKFFIDEMDGNKKKTRTDFYRSRYTGFHIEETDFIFSCFAETWQGAGDDWSKVSEIRQYQDKDNLKVYAIFFKNESDEEGESSWLAIAVDSNGKTLDCAGKTYVGNILKLSEAE